MQDARRLAPYTSHQERVCALHAALGSDSHVQQSEQTLGPADGQDMDSVTSAVSTLKRLSILEPDLIMPPLMERIVPSLQGLEEVRISKFESYSC